jgi:hypothetical protein
MVTADPAMPAKNFVHGYAKSLKFLGRQVKSNRMETHDDDHDAQVRQNLREIDARIDQVRERNEGQRNKA